MCVMANFPLENLLILSSSLVLYVQCFTDQETPVMSHNGSVGQHESVNNMKPAVPTSTIGLSSYLSRLRQVLFSDPAKNTPKVTVILGNPSCDLDSFVSAFVLSYFYNCRSQQSERLYVPLLNLPDVIPSDLWRLRPEFGVAMRSAIDGLKPQSSKTSEDTRERDKTLLEQLITIKELRESSKAMTDLREAFRSSAQNRNQPTDKTQDAILVDHNAPSILDISEQDLNSHFMIVGCIDHHVDESYVASNADPRIITTGIGSCTSLVVKHLRETGLWSHADGSHWDAATLRQVCKLALAPILVDTRNLTATGDKCSDTDRSAVAFLEQNIGKDFDRQQLFDEVSAAKSESLNLLTMSEILARDYKQWDEDAETSEIVIGISSMVKGIDWLVKHAGGQQKFIESVLEYTQDPERHLGLFGMLTWTGTGKELTIFSFSKQAEKSLEIFQQNARELQLQDWNEDSSLVQVVNEKMTDTPGWSWKVWWMGDTSKSRKQVAPLLRDAVKQASAG